MLAVPAWAEVVTFSYTFAAPQVRMTADGKALVSIPGCTQDASVAGSPMVPVCTSRLLLPENSEIVSVETQLGNMVALPGAYTLAHATTPVPTSMRENALNAQPDAPNQTVYASSAPFPAAALKQASPQRLHGRAVAVTTFTPVQYVPATGMVSYAKTVTVTVQLRAATAADRAVGPAPSTRRGPLRELKEFIDNKDMLPSPDDSGSTSATAAGATAAADTVDTSRQYLIITTAELQNAFEALRVHRASAAGGGYETYLTTVEAISSSMSGRDLAEKIRNFIIQSYQNYGTEYVVLGGDADGAPANQVLPTRGCTATVDSYVDNNIPADLYYACLDGDWDYNANNVFGETGDGAGGADIDWLPEVAVGRIPVDTVTEVQNAVGKIIAYDTMRSPPLKALMVGEQLDTTPTWGGDNMDWIAGYMGDFARETLYDRDLSGSAWTKTTLQEKLGSNAFTVVFHLGHSNVSYNMRMNNTDIEEIRNTTPYLLYSQGCYAGSFDGRESDLTYSYSDSIGEDFLVRTNCNTFAYIGNSRYGWYYQGSYVEGASNLLHKQFAEAVFQDTPETLGRANNLSKQGLDYTDGLYRWLAFEVNLFGDPATILRVTQQSGSGIPPAILNLLLE